MLEKAESFVPTFLCHCRPLGAAILQTTDGYIAADTDRSFPTIDESY